MRRLLLTFALGLLLVVRATSQSEELVYGRFADYLEALRVQTGIPGLSAAIVGRSDLLWERGFGFSDVERAVPMRPDTPVHIESLTQVFTAGAVLRCAEEGRLSLDARLGTLSPNAPEPDLTVRQVLTHTSGPGATPAFVYAPDRLDPLAGALEQCAGKPYRTSVADLLDRLAMTSSVPGGDVPSFELFSLGTFPTREQREQYLDAIGRLARPYAVDAQRRATPGQYSYQSISASRGLITTVRDYARFDLALRTGVLVQADTLAAAWRAPLDELGRPLPHAVGWFVQNYNGEPVVWQFGSASESDASAMAITLPARGLTFVLLANSSGLVRPFALDKGDVTKSPFARVFLALFTR